MKASLKFREERSPLLRVKVPLSVAGFPFSSGVVLGDSEDLALHLGTLFDAGPVLKVAYKPNYPTSPVSLILKTGIGPWGSPSGAALAMTAELNLLGKVGPIFSMHLKPRLGDFSLSKQLNSVSKSHIGLMAEARNGEVQGRDLDLNAPTPLKLEKCYLFTPMPKPNSLHDGLLSGLSVEDSKRVNDWGNDSEKVSGSTNVQIDRGPAGRKPNSHSFTEDQSDPASPIAVSVGGDALPNAHEDGLPQKHSECVSVTRSIGIDGSFRGWNVNAHSTLPVGKQAELKILWGMKVPSQFTRGWGTAMPNFTLPYLSVQKISIESLNPGAQTSKSLQSLPEPAKCGQLQPLATTAEIRELSHVAALCGSMKRHLRLLYAENDLLKKAMEEMKAEFEPQGSAVSWRSAGAVADVLVEEQIITGPKSVDDLTRENGAVSNTADVNQR